MFESEKSARAIERNMSSNFRHTLSVGWEAFAPSKSEEVTV